MTTQNITSVLKETRQFAPSAEFVSGTRVSAAERDRLAEWAERDPEAFWAEQAKSLHWFKPWKTVLDWSNAPHAKWFVGGTINASYNCLDRHLAERGNKAAIIWEGEPGDSRTLTYQQLHREVCKFANALKSL
jgi:acetyl-CoA synthetase